MKLQVDVPWVHPAEICIVALPWLVMHSTKKNCPHPHLFALFLWGGLTYFHFIFSYEIVVVHTCFVHVCQWVDGCHWPCS